MAFEASRPAVEQQPPSVDTASLHVCHVLLRLGYGGMENGLVADGETGAIVPPRDPESLAARLIPYLVSVGLRQRHGAAGRERAVAEFSLDGMLRAYGEIYRRVAGFSAVPLPD